MQRVFTIHGIYGHPEENWLPWLKRELEKLDCEVVTPAFPTPENQSLENWMEIFKGHQVGEGDILVGHSLGAALVIRFLEDYKARAAFLVAGFVEPLGILEVDELNKSFYGPVGWEQVRKNCERFFVYVSDNDPYVPLEMGLKMARGLGVEANVVKGAGHFNEAAGYTHFERLLEDIRGFLAE